MRSVRAQVIGSMVALLCCGLALSGVLDYRVQFQDVEERVTTDLTQEVREFEEFALLGVDPRTGEPLTDLDEVLAIGVDSSYPEAHLTLVGLLDGEVAHAQSDAPSRPAVDASPGTGPIDLTREPAALADVLSAPLGAFGTTRTSRGETRFLTIRPELAGDPREARFVALYLVGAERAEVTGTIPGRILVYTLVIVVVAIVGWFVAGRLLAPLRDLSLATEQISDDNPSLRVDVRGGNEIATLGRRFNGMLDRLEQALASQRDLLNDVSHELRTPVTIVRGHLDLLDAADPADVVATRALVLDELDRMSRLVDDLITLAKSDRPDFVQPEPVDLTLLTDEVAERLVGLADRRWRVDAAAEGVVLLDRDRVVQALLALASNAVRHTAADGVVALGTSRVAAAEPRLHLWVRDTGPGVEPADVTRIFERFGRGSGEASHTGTGLGLSIVQAVARGHGGEVRLDNRPGDGATFVLDLPWRDAPAAADHGGSGVAGGGVAGGGVAVATGTPGRDWFTAVRRARAPGARPEARPPEAAGSPASEGDASGRRPPAYEEALYRPPRQGGHDPKETST